jgi:hypothetical protein
MITAPHPALTSLGDINWDDTRSILQGTQPVFDALGLGDPQGLLADLLRAPESNPHLREMCEQYDFLSKLVLHDDPQSQVRVRLHLFRPGYFDRPHNHRWSFASRILSGSYRHRILGSDESFTEDTDPDTMTTVYERVEGPGSTYALHHTSVHSIDAEAGTASLLVRGPAAKDRFLIIDRTTGPFWAYGAASETPEQRASKGMTSDQIRETITTVRLLTGLAPAISGTERGR